MNPNVLVIVATGLIPMIVGMVWYSPALFGNAWLKEAGLTAEDMKANQKPLKFLFGFIFNVLLAFGLFTMVTHEFSVLGLVGGKEELLKTGSGAAFLSDYGGDFSTLFHGAVHGIFATLLTVVPIIGHQCLWSGKSLKYFLLDVGFWLVSIILMSCIIAKWGGIMIV